MSYLAFDDERFFLVTPCLRPLTETSWKKGSLIQIIAENIQGKIGWLFIEPAQLPDCLRLPSTD